MEFHPKYKDYLVSESGEVYSVKFGKKKLLKAHQSKDNFRRYVLTVDKKQKCITEHRLVADIYLPNPNNCNTVRHLNRDRSDNHVSNLEWYNHGVDVLNFAKQKQWSIMNVDTGEVVVVNSLKSWCEENDISYYSIRKTFPNIKNRQDNHKGYRVITSK